MLGFYQSLPYPGERKTQLQTPLAFHMEKDKGRNVFGGSMNPRGSDSAGLGGVIQTYVFKAAGYISCADMLKTHYVQTRALHPPRAVRWFASPNLHLSIVGLQENRSMCSWSLHAPHSL